MLTKRLKTLSLLACFSLSACAPGPHLFVTTQLINGGQELSPGMLNRNLIATVGFDESFVGNYVIPARATAYLQGVQEGTPEYQLRTVYLNLRLLHSPGLTHGKYNYPTVAAVPDHLEKLKVWDLVEYRSTGTYRALMGFTTKQEGNVIVKVLCRRADPDYEKCRDALPQIRDYPQGSVTPYLASVKEYGYTFTPAYDAKGQPTRNIPEYVPPAQAAKGQSPV